MSQYSQSALRAKPALCILRPKVEATTICYAEGADEESSRALEDPSTILRKWAARGVKLAFVAVIAASLVGCAVLGAKASAPGCSGSSHHARVGFPFPYFGTVEAVLPTEASDGKTHAFFRLADAGTRGVPKLTAAEQSAVATATRCLMTKVRKMLYFAFRPNGSRVQFILFLFNGRSPMSPRVTLIPGGRVLYQPDTGDVITTM